VVRLIVPDASGRVLLLRRPDRGEVAAWSLPGGTIEYGETVAEAAARELAEETGLRLTACRFLFYQDSPPLSPGGMHCINFYLECEAGGEVTLNAESADFAWIRQDDATAYRIVFRNDLALGRYWSTGGGGRDRRVFRVMPSML
jgi:ADP-ribose pyrophosphatase YjhB (NUDIX family)